MNTKHEFTRIADEREGTAGIDEGRGLSGKRPTHATSKTSGASSSRCCDDCSAHIHDSPLPGFLRTCSKCKRWAQIQTTPRPPPPARRRLLRPRRLSQLCRLRRRRRNLLLLLPTRSQLQREQHRLLPLVLLLLRPVEPERARLRAEATVTLPRRQTSSNATRTSCSGQRRTRWSIWRSLTSSWRS